MTIKQVRGALMTETPENGAGLWLEIRRRMSPEPAEGFAALAALAAPWRLYHGRFRAVQPFPEAISGAPNFILDGRHAELFVPRLAALAEQGWAAPSVALAWRAAITGDLASFDGWRRAIAEISAAEGEGAFAALAALLEEGGPFLRWLGHDLALRRQYRPARLDPVRAPVFFRGDMAQVRIAGSAEFAARDFPQ